MWVSSKVVVVMVVVVVVSQGCLSGRIPADLSLF